MSFKVLIAYANTDKILACTFPFLKFVIVNIINASKLYFVNVKSGVPRIVVGLISSEPNRAGKTTSVILFSFPPSVVLQVRFYYSQSTWRISRAFKPITSDALFFYCLIITYMN